MANTLSQFTVMRTLARREFWEQRLLFLYVPMSVTFFYTALRIVQAVRGWQNRGDSDYLAAFLAGRTPEEISMMEEIGRTGFLNVMYSADVGTHVLTFSCMMMFYCLTTLFQQRRSRHVLFFSSMPVSQRQTVLSKALSGLGLAQGVYLLWALLMMLVLFVSRALHASLVGVDLWNGALPPPPLAGRLVDGFLISVVSVLWCLPGYAWLLFCSAWAKQAPLAWAAGPFALISLPALLLFNNTELPVALLGHFVPLFVFEPGNSNALDTVQSLGWNNLLLSVVVGMGFLFAAIRFNRVDTD